MLGILRFVLAMFVVVAHLTEGTQFFSHWGIFAVFGFYLVSGYLITLILNDVYQFQASQFALNRFLRLFPVFYAVLVLSTLIVFLAPGAAAYHPAWEIKTRLADVFGNLLLFPFEFYDHAFRIVPPTWSVGVEIINYFLLWLVIARSRLLAVAAVLLSLAYHLISLGMDEKWETRYFPAYAAVLPFALGALIYFSHGRLARFSSATVKPTFMIAALLWIANIVTCGIVAGLGGPHFNIFYYLNLLFLLVIVGVITTPGLGHLFKRSGKLLGDLSYPVFLIHWQIGFVVSVLLLNSQRRGLELYALSLLPVVMTAYGLAKLGEKWIDPLRGKIRRQATEARYTDEATGANGKVAAVTP